MFFNNNKLLTNERAKSWTARTQSFAAHFLAAYSNVFLFPKRPDVGKYFFLAVATEICVDLIAFRAEIAAGLGERVE